MNRQACMRGTCGSVVSFQDLPKRRRPLASKEITATMSSFFSSIGYTRVGAVNIANINGLTDLVIAGVQIFDDIIHQGKPVREERIFVVQPCVRMHCQSQIQSQDGLSTSFVNVCTERMSEQFGAHLQAIDEWCRLLSSIGLHMNDFTLVLRTSEKEWGTGPFSALEIFFVYRGLELGDAAYLLVPQPTRAAISISDIGFGLERIVWAVNRRDSYFDTLTPLTFSGPKELFDSCRTLALLALCDVRGSSRGPGLQLRRFAKIVSEKYYGEDAFQILRHYFDYWSAFVSPSTDKESAVQAVRLEVERFLNLRISAERNLPPPQGETTEAYFHRLAYNHKTNDRELRKAIATLKKPS